MKRTPLKTNKTLRRGQPLERRTEMPKVSAKKAGKLAAGEVKVSRRGPAVSPDVRAALKLRAGEGEWCEMQLTGCAGRGVDPSHRIAVGAGGRHGEAKKKHDRLSNLMWACRVCHDWCHSRWAEAEDMGLFLKDGSVPTQEPVVYRGVLSYLTDDGRVVDFEEVCA